MLKGYLSTSAAEDVDKSVLHYQVMDLGPVGWHLLAIHT